MSRKGKTAFFTIFAAAVLTVLAFYAVAQGQKPSAAPEQEAFAKKFHEFENIDGREVFPALPLYDLEDREYSGDELVQGQPVLVNLWATWCAPCITELPALMTLQEYMAGRGSGFRIVYISLDDPDNGAHLLMALDRFDLEKLPTHYARGQALWSALQIKALPASILLSPDGKIQYRMTGDTDWTDPAAIKFIERFSQIHNDGDRTSKLK